MDSAVRQSAERISEVAVNEGVDVGEKFPGYAAYDTPLEDIYGGNVERLKELKRRVDPLEGSSFDEPGFFKGLDVFIYMFFVDVDCFPNYFFC